MHPSNAGAKGGLQEELVQDATEITVVVVVPVLVGVVLVVDETVLVIVELVLVVFVVLLDGLNTSVVYIYID